MLLLLALVCAAPVIASYFMYYVFKPTGGTHELRRADRTAAADSR